MFEFGSAFIGSGASGFKSKVERLAREAGLKVAECSDKRAFLRFNVNGHTQPLFIHKFDQTWEFSCPTLLRADNPIEFPVLIMATVLEDNSRSKKGFWCIERIGDKCTISCMHNIQENLIDAKELHRICWAVVKRVESLEESMRQYLR